jgi:hypothetical protein
MGRSRKVRATLDTAYVARFAAEVRARFRALPHGEEIRIARYACRRDTERVGALSQGGYLAEAVDLAVIAHARHRFTRYESLLDAGYDRDEARAQVQPDVSALLRSWTGYG